MATSSDVSQIGGFSKGHNEQGVGLLSTELLCLVSAVVAMIRKGQNLCLS